MTIYYIDPTAQSGGDGTFSAPYNTFPTPTANNTYLLKEKTTYYGSFLVGVNVLNVSLGTYDSVTGEQILQGDRKATIDGTGTTLTVRWREGAHNGKIQNIVVINSDTGSQVWGMYLGNTAAAPTNYMTVKNCQIKNIRSDKTADSGGIKLQGSYGLIENCYIADVPTDGIFVQGTDNTIRNCTIVQVDRDGRGIGDNIQITGNATLGCSRFLVENCWLEHLETDTKQCINAQDTTNGSAGGVFKYNKCFIKTSTNTPNQGIYIDIANSKIIGNYIEGGTYNIYVAENNCLIAGNICKAGRYGIYQASTTTGGYIVNNTIVNSDLSGIYCSTNASLTIKNNILLNNNTGVSKDGGASEDYNLYYGNTTNQVNLTGSASWGSNIFTENPKLTTSLYPNQNSPVINAGTFLTFYKDYQKTLFSRSPSIGAYEYVVERGIR